jgi:HEAT repeat protein
MKTKKSIDKKMNQIRQELDDNSDQVDHHFAQDQGIDTQEDTRILQDLQTQWKTGARFGGQLDLEAAITLIRDMESEDHEVRIHAALQFAEMKRDAIAPLLYVLRSQLQSILNFRESACEVLIRLQEAGDLNFDEVEVLEGLEEMIADIDMLFVVQTALETFQE